MQTSLKRSLGWIEAGLYLGGLALLAAYAMIRIGDEREREAGIAAFETVQVASPASRQVLLADSAATAGVPATIAVPDQSLWAEGRIREYQDSLAVEAAPPLAVLNIGRLGIEVPVYDGADDFNLNRGVGRIEGTAPMDATGNLGIAGHRDGFFRGLKDIEIDDRIDLRTRDGDRVYTVDAIDIVDPEDVWVLGPTPMDTITLVTCYPFYYVGHAPKRFIVRATAERS